MNGIHHFFNTNVTMITILSVKCARESTAARRERGTTEVTDHSSAAPRTEDNVFIRGEDAALY